MTRCIRLLLASSLLTGCPPFPAQLATCEEAGECDNTTEAAGSSDVWLPTTSDGVQTVTGEPDDSSGSTAPAEETTAGTTGEPALPPAIVDSVVIPDYIDDNGLLSVEVKAQHSEGVRMLLPGDVLVELTENRPGEFFGHIDAFTALDNGKHKAVLTPWRAMIEGEPVDAYYVIALPKLEDETGWQTEGLEGNVAAIAVLPDGSPVELDTFIELGEPRCYLRKRDKKGKPLEKLVPVLAGGYCRAIDLKIDRSTGRLQVLVERKNGDDIVWWAGESPAWGKGLQKIGIGEVGDTAYALAARPDVVAVCGTRAVASMDKLDALAVLLRPGEPAEARVFDYQVPGDDVQHKFTETARDCAFAGDTLVLVGETNGQHDAAANIFKLRDRLMMIESDLVAADDPAWTVAGLDQGVQTRALALDLDDQGRYVLAGYTCFDTCEPVGEVRVYAPGGTLAAPTASLGPLGSPWFGPHDIAWSPAGYAVVALGEQGQNFVFKVQAVTPGLPLPLWTFLPGDKQGLQLALAVAVGPYGEVYAGGIAEDDHPAFARIGG